MSDYRMKIELDSRRGGCKCHPDKSTLPLISTSYMYSSAYVVGMYLLIKRIKSAMLLYLVTQITMGSIIIRTLYFVMPAVILRRCLIRFRFRCLIRFCSRLLIIPLSV